MLYLCEITALHSMVSHMPLTAFEKDIANDIEALIASDRLVLPTLPEMALKAREVAQDPDVTALQLSKVVQDDPALSVRLLRVANSPLMRAQRQIDDLHQAIARMGITFACNLISALAMRQMFQATTDTVDRLMRGVWSHSTQVAGIASVLCLHYTKLKTDQATLAGLVHQIGILPLLSYAEMHPDLLQSGMTLTQTIDSLHPQIGEMILRQWDFSEDLIAVPRGYTQFDREVPKADYVDLVTVANLECLYGSDHPLTQINWQDVNAFKRLGLNPDPDQGDAALQQEKNEASKALD